jgi:hypothetical protein
MTDPRDSLETWLQAEVEPLAPPPGTFERIRRRARRRKAGRALVSAAGVVIVIAAAVAVPRVAGPLLRGQSGRTGPEAAAGPASPSARPQATGNGHQSLNADSGTQVTQPGSALSPGGSGNPVPANFQPTSVTFIGPHIGAVIGQAGTPGHCATVYCTSLAGTSDYGTSWYGVSAPVTGPPSGALGVSQIRFLNTRDGWAFGPQLWVTHDGGAAWAQENTYGMRVTDLETVGDRAFALFATCTGSGASYGADCTSFSLYSSLATSDQWLPVPGPAAHLGLPQTGATQAGSASLVLTGGPTTGRGYLFAPSGKLLSGPLTGAAWTIADAQAPCVPGLPGPDGQPTGTLLAAGSDHLILVCNSATSAAGDSQTKIVMQSSDGGATWSTVGHAPPTGIATSLAAAQGNLVVLATNAGIDISRTGGSTWQPTQASPSDAAAGEHGFSYVGMTSQLGGVALPADPGLHEVFITTDGGLTWQPHSVSSP